jgi:hypothetical protein
MVDQDSLLMFATDHKSDQTILHSAPLPGSQELEGQIEADRSLGQRMLLYGRRGDESQCVEILIFD